MRFDYCWCFWSFHPIQQKTFCSFKRKMCLFLYFCLYLCCVRGVAMAARCCQAGSGAVAGLDSKLTAGNTTTALYTRTAKVAKPVFMQSVQSPQLNLLNRYWIFPNCKILKKKTDQQLAILSCPQTLLHIRRTTSFLPKFFTDPRTRKLSKWVSHNFVKW